MTHLHSPQTGSQGINCLRDRHSDTQTSQQVTNDRPESIHWHATEGGVSGDERAHGLPSLRLHHSVSPSSHTKVTVPEYPGMCRKRKASPPPAAGPSQIKRQKARKESVEPVLHSDEDVDTQATRTLAEPLSLSRKGGRKSSEKKAERAHKPRRAKQPSMGQGIPFISTRLFTLEQSFKAGTETKNARGTDRRYTLGPTNRALEFLENPFVGTLLQTHLTCAGCGTFYKLDLRGGGMGASNFIGEGRHMTKCRGNQLLQKEMDSGYLTPEEQEELRDVRERVTRINQQLEELPFELEDADVETLAIRYERKTDTKFPYLHKVRHSAGRPAPPRPVGTLPVFQLTDSDRDLQESETQDRTTLVNLPLGPFAHTNAPKSCNEFMNPALECLRNPQEKPREPADADIRARLSSLFPAISTSPSYRSLEVISPARSGVTLSDGSLIATPNSFGRRSLPPPEISTSRKCSISLLTSPWTPPPRDQKNPGRRPGTAYDPIHDDVRSVDDGQSC